MSGADRTATVLRQEILRGARAVGSALPPERALAEEYGVSRTTVRAALSGLEAEGLVERRVGRGGGTFVTEPGACSVTEALRLAIGMSGFPAADLAEARCELEPRCAALAAGRLSARTLEELGRLQGAMAKARTRDEFFDANARFHGLIAQNCGNSVLAAIVGGLIAPIRELTDDPLRIRAEELRQTVRVHELLLAALTAGDADTAESVMRSHLFAHAKVVCGGSCRS